jgi:hypothetical protein
MPMMSPMGHIGAFAIQDITERSRPGVAGTAEHGVFASCFPGKKHAISVVGQEAIFHLVESREAGGVLNANCWPMTAIAPSDVISVLDSAHA